MLMNHSTVSGSWWEKNRLFPVSRASSRAIRGQGEVKDVEILLHPFLFYGLGDDHHPLLNQKPQGSLGRGLAMGTTDLLKHRVPEEIQFPLGKGPPGLQLGAVLPQNGGGGRNQPLYG